MTGPKIIVEYIMPDNDDAFREAYLAPEAWAALRDADEGLRNQLKHGDPAKDRDAMDSVRQIIGEALGRLE